MRPSTRSTTEVRPTRYWFPLLLLAPIAAVYLYLSWTDQLVGRGGDNAFYVLMAQSYSPYASHDTTIPDYFTRRSQYPPLYPLLLALTGAAHNFLAAHIVTTICLLISFLLLYRLATTSGLPITVAIAVSATFPLLPGTYTQTFYLLSENLYLLLSLLFFLVYAATERTERHFIALAIIAAATALTRTAGVSLLVTYAIYLLVTRPRGWLAYLALAFAPVAAWNAYAYSLGAHYVNQISPGEESDFFSNLATRLFTQYHALLYGWTSNLSASEALSVHSTALGALCLVGTAVRLTGGHLDGIYVVAYLAIMLFWPFPAEASRFVFVLVPLLLVHGASIVHRILLHLAPTVALRGGAMVVPLLATLIGLPDTVVAVQRFGMSIPTDLEPFRRDPTFLIGPIDQSLFNARVHSAFANAARGVADTVPVTDCILSVKPSVVALMSNRMSKAAPPANLDQKDFDLAVEREECRFVLFLNMAFPGYGTRMYPYDRLSTPVEIIRRYDVAIDNGSMTIAAIGRLISP